LRDRTFAIITAFLALAGAIAAPLPVHATVAPAKVVIIVGPVGGTTANYRSQGDQIAAAASADGATVVKVYSPNATWAAVKAAVAGANIIVYLGHGNGYPNPYNTSLTPEKVDGWGLNRVAGIDANDPTGDGDSWSTNMAYCGEATLVSATRTAGSVQQTYCAGGPIAPAAGFVMIYSSACYAPGASEPGATQATPTQALQRVGYYSRPVLGALHGSGYFATDHGATPLVHALLTSPTRAYGDIYSGHLPTGLVAADSPDPAVTGLRAWLAVRSSDPYYTYAFAGDPTRTFAGGHADLTLPRPPASALPPTPGAVSAPSVAARAPTGTTVATSTSVTATFSEPVTGVSAATFALTDLTKAVAVSASVSYDATTRVATLRPAAALAAVHSYRASLGSAIVDAQGNHLTAYSWTFTTIGPGVTAYSPARSIHFSTGSTTGYRFDSIGRVTASKAYSLTKVSSASANQRSKAIPGHGGAWFYIINGVWAGYWVAESTRTYLPGIAEQVTYAPAHSVSFNAGTYTGYRFTSAWLVSGSKPYTLLRASSASTSRWAVINGRGYAYIINGVWAGYWVPTGGGVAVH
jgi:Bacterial Ig-like domain